MRGIALALFTTGIVILAAVLVVYTKPPSRGTLQIASRIAELVKQPGVHEVYVPGVVTFEDGKVIVEIAGERAEASTPISLTPSSSSGLVMIISDGETAWIEEP